MWSVVFLLSSINYVSKVIACMEVFIWILLLIPALQNDGPTISICFLLLAVHIPISFFHQYGWSDVLLNWNCRFSVTNLLKLIQDMQSYTVRTQFNHTLYLLYFSWNSQFLFVFPVMVSSSSLNLCHEILLL